MCKVYKHNVFIYIYIHTQQQQAVCKIARNNMRKLRKNTTVEQRAKVG